MNRFFKFPLGLGLLLFSFFTYCQNPQRSQNLLLFEDLSPFIEEFQHIIVAVHDRNISPDSAKHRFQKNMRGFDALVSKNANDAKDSTFIFPLKGHTYKNVGGEGKGYRIYKFDFFDDSRRGSHPAQDIFIRDVNQDCLNDYTKKPVEVLSVRDGVVLNVIQDWDSTNTYRGGKVVWVYDPAWKGLFYYAHQQSVFVKAGDYVKAGQAIGEVGRTGLNAYQKRSDTHLHMMYMKLDTTFAPRPVNTYRWLKKAKVVL